MTMKSEKHSPNFEAPMTGQMLIPEQCKNCIFRDKTKVVLEGKTIDAGASKSVCDMFEYPDMKPVGVLKNTEECEYYEKE